MNKRNPRGKPEYWLLVLALAGIVIGTLATFGDSLATSHAGLPTPLNSSRPALSDEEAWRIQDEQNTMEVFEAVRRGVVKVTTSWARDQREDRLPWSARKGNGSGFFVDGQGHVVTNYHVVEDAASIEVQTSSGRTYPAAVAGADRLTDLAVLDVEVPQEEVFPLTLADFSLVRVGQKAIVMGSPLATGSSMGLGRSPTITTGIVSAIDRSMPIESVSKPNVNDFTIEHLIQTDAAVNPGNSGGPLLNSSGEVVGVVTAIMDSANGIGFAIPSQVVAGVVPDLIENGRVVRAFMGISYLSLDVLYEELGEDAYAEAGWPQSKGALITGLEEQGPGKKAGLRSSEETVTAGGEEFPTGGDIIVGLDGEAITGSNLHSELGEHRPGDKIVLDVLRHGRVIEVEMTLGSR